YPGGVNTVDAFEGGLAEHDVAGSDVGPTFQAIMVDQFQRLRDGDRFFYLNQSFDKEESVLLQQVNTLAKVIMANTEVTNLQSNVMLFTASISGTVVSQGSGKTTAQMSAVSGATVKLEDTAGDVLATAKTDAHGRYAFNQLSGPSGNPAIPSGVSSTGF